MLVSVAKELTEYFPALESATGTLSINISLKADGDFSTLQSCEDGEKMLVEETSDNDAATAATGCDTSVSIAKKELGKLNISPRRTIEETSAPENVVQCIDHRPVPFTSPSATPVDTPLNPLRLEKAPHCQVSQTPTPASRCNSFIDLNPSPLPLPDYLPDHLLEIASSLYSKMEMHETVLGRGGDGTVYLLFCPKWAFAVKRVPANSETKDIIREAEIMMGLNHPNIVGCFGSGFIDDYFNIIMEWMPGGSLRKLLRHMGPFRDKEIIDYTFQLLSGLKYLHENNILHHDIKGDNLFIGSAGQLKIGDFGHAHYMVDGVVCSYMRGTIQYMAPEYIRSGKFTVACDVWSVGCVMMEMATLEPPWPEWAENSAALMYKLGNTTKPPDIPDFLSPSVQELMSACFQIDPNLRPSAAELLCHKAFDGYPQCCSPHSATGLADLPSIASGLDCHPSC